jgi:hypothetical protein
VPKPNNSLIINHCKTARHIVRIKRSVKTLTMCRFHRPFWVVMLNSPQDWILYLTLILTRYTDVVNRFFYGIRAVVGIPESRQVL